MRVAAIASTLFATAAVAQPPAQAPDRWQQEAREIYREAVNTPTVQGRGQVPALAETLMEHVGHDIGKFARPKRIRFADAVPKTRSGKIMRRLLRDLAAGRTAAGDMTTLEDISVLAKLRESDE